MIPDKTRQEWRDLIKGQLNYKCSSYSLQMKINSLQRSHKMGLIKMDDAVDDLYQLCTKFEKIYTDDLNQIFNS